MFESNTNLKSPSSFPSKGSSANVDLEGFQLVFRVNLSIAVDLEKSPLASPISVFDNIKPTTCI